MYEEEKSFNVIQGKVPEFTESDVKVAVLIDGESSNDFPENDGRNTGYEVECNNEAIGEWNNTKWSLELTNLKKNKTTCTVKFATSRKLNDIVIAKGKESTSVEKFEHEATEQTPSLIDYRYVGKNPNNYVYFGCDNNCTEDNLYRIIGVIPTQSIKDGTYENRVKLIKENFYYEKTGEYLVGKTADTVKVGMVLPIDKGYRWNQYDYNNDWKESSLFNQVLNDLYWKELGEYQEYITQSILYMGAIGMEERSTFIPQDFYNSERGNTKGASGGDLLALANVGLMYPSDLGFSVGKEYINQPIAASKPFYLENSWLKINHVYHEWTITPEKGEIIEPAAFGATSDGNIYPYQVNYMAYIQEIRPTFYLKENVLYKSGNGTVDSPYRITLN